MEPRGRERRKEGEKEDMKTDNSERWGEMAQKSRRETEMIIHSHKGWIFFLAKQEKKENILLK